jgi:hypothetical protein
MNDIQLIFHATQQHFELNRPDIALSLLVIDAISLQDHRFNMH